MPHKGGRPTEQAFRAAGFIAVQPVYGHRVCHRVGAQ